MKTIIESLFGPMVAIRRQKVDGRVFLIFITNNDARFMICEDRNHYDGTISAFFDCWYSGVETYAGYLEKLAILREMAEHYAELSRFVE